MKKHTIDEIASAVVDSAIEVHRNLGPGLLESVYEVCLEQELISAGLKVSRQVPVPIIYKGVKMEKAFYIDLLVEEEIIIELKVVEKVLPVHEAQLISYLKLADKRLGFLMNFNAPLMKNGIKRRINGFLE